MRLQQNHNEGGLTPWDGADMLRMLQFFELAIGEWGLLPGMESQASSTWEVPAALYM